MEEDMFSFFPDGVRALLVDDDIRFTRAASVLLNILHFRVNTRPSPSAGLRYLSRDNNNVADVVLCDTHKAAACGFDFRSIVETDLHIPVIYFFESEQQAVADEVAGLVRVLETATFVIKKPLDADEAAQLWKVVAWRRYLLGRRNASGNTRMPPLPVFGAPGSGGHGGGGLIFPLLPGPGVDDDGDDSAVVEEDRAHYKVVTSGGRKRKQRKRRYTSSVTGMMNVKSTLERQNVATHLQAPRKYRKTPPPPPQQQKNKTDERRPQEYNSQDSVFVKAIRPTLTDHAAHRNTLHFAAAGSAWPSNAATSAAPPPAAFHSTATPPAAMPAPVEESVPMPAPVEEPAQLSGGQATLTFPQQLMFFGPFPYQGPQLPSVQNVLGDLLTGATATAATIGAGAASLAATYAGNDDNGSLVTANLGAAAVAQSEAVAPDVQVAADHQLAAGGGEEDQFVFPLETLMGLDMPMDVGGASSAAVHGAGGMGMSWDLGTENFTLIDNLFNHPADDDFMLF